MKVAIVPVTPFVQNCSILWCPRTMRGVVVDPGGDCAKIVAAINEHEVAVERILLTHGHIDHAGGAAELAETLDVPIEGPHPEDGFLIDGLAEQGAQWGLDGARPFTPERWLDENDEVSFGDVTLGVRHCPGHTPGHVVYYDAATRVALVGDVLFRGSIGRTDFPRGDHETLIGSIRGKLWPLGDDMNFVPGHGPISTFGTERRTNPFVAD